MSRLLYAETPLVIRDKSIAEKYQKNWELHGGHSERWNVKFPPPEAMVSPTKPPHGNVAHEDR